MPLAGLATFIIGGLTGVMVAVAPFDYQAHDTFFVVGHLHYVLIGGTIFPIIAGVYYYYPVVAGKQLSERLGRLAFWLMLIGFNVNFLPMHLSGLLGMPRRVWTYPDDLNVGLLNFISTVGAFILAGGIAVFLVDVLRPKGKQPLVRRNVWNAGTLEWSADVPEKPWGIRSIPVIESRYPLWDQEDFLTKVDEGKFYLPDAAEGLRETLVTTTVDAEPIQCLRVPGPTFLTLIAAALTGGVFILGTYHWYASAAISGLLAFATIVVWLWTGTAIIPEKDVKSVGLGLRLPIYVSGPSAVGWWAMFITMLGDMTAFVSLVFGYFFFWTIHDDFPPETLSGPGWAGPLVAATLGLLAWGSTVLTRRFNRSDRGVAFYVSTAAAILFACLGAGALVYGPWQFNMDPTEHAYSAIVCVLVLWTVLHLAVGILMLLYCAARRVAGRMTNRYDADITNVTLYWHFLVLTVAITALTIGGFPLAA